MAKTFALDGGDLAVPVVLTEDVAQGVGVRLRLIRGEFAPNLRLGLPWLPNDQVPDRDAILGGKLASQARRTRIRREVIEMIRSTPGIDRVLEVQIELVGREIRMAFRARKFDGSQVSGSEVIRV